MLSCIHRTFVLFVFYTWCLTLPLALLFGNETQKKKKQPTKASCQGLSSLRGLHRVKSKGGNQEKFQKTRANFGKDAVAYCITNIRIYMDPHKIMA